MFFVVDTLDFHARHFLHISVPLRPKEFPLMIAILFGLLDLYNQHSNHDKLTSRDSGLGSPVSVVLMCRFSN